MPTVFASAPSQPCLASGRAANFHHQRARAALPRGAAPISRPASTFSSVSGTRRGRPLRSARFAAHAMVTQAEWQGTPAAAADSSSSLCDAWAEKEVQSSGIKFNGIHHVAIICASLDRSLEFYCGLLGAACLPRTADATTALCPRTREGRIATASPTPLATAPGERYLITPTFLRRPCGMPHDRAGLKINKERPHKNLPYRGAWLWTGERSSSCVPA